MADCIWKDLSEVAFLKRGIVISKDFLRDNYGIYPVYSSQTIDDGIMGYINTFMFDGEFLTWTTDGANAGTIFHRKGKFNITNVCGLIEIKDNNILYRFLYYWLSYTAKQYVLEGMGNPKLMSNRMGLIKIPIPHIKVQEEIVKILDSFTNLIDALNEELSLRQKQFEYYREKLLTFDDKSIYTNLGNVGEFTRGNGLQKKDFTETGFPCIHYGQIHTSYNTSTKSTISYCSKTLAKKLKKAKYGDLLIATTSEDVDACCKAIAWLGDGEVAYSGDSFCFSHKENPKYLAYLFQCNLFADQKRKCATGAKVVRVSGESMSNFILPIPSLDIQQSIVSKLDAFESLISSLKEEIALRQKQYEYYREKLLTFE